VSTPNTISYSFGKMLGVTAASGIPGQSSFFIARVTYVLLDNTDTDKFNKIGGWKAIGSIECIPFINFNDSKTDPIIARPINGNYTQYPLINEIVLVKVLISKQAQNNIGNYNPEFYYTDIISVWNAPEHNAVPDISFFKENPNSMSVTGLFLSNGETKRLVKAPGDITIEGRRGGSIRLGSNTPGFNTPWVNKNSKPVLVLSNNPLNIPGPARFEDVNKDGSILVMMAGHNIGFIPASINFESYDTVVTISEKQNITVVDQAPVSKENESLSKTDSVPIAKEVPVTKTIPVSNPVPPTKTTEVKTDEELMPEREDLAQNMLEFEYIIYAQDNEQEDVVASYSTYLSPLKNNSNKSLGNLYYHACSVYNQADPLWGNNTDSSGLKMSKFGCAYTSFSMLVTNKKGSGLYTPQYLWQNYSKSVNVRWNDLSKALGLEGTLTKTRSINSVDSVISIRPLMFEWKNILSYNTAYKNKYTKRTHWLVISGKNKDGTYTVLDPNKREPLYNQTKEMIEAGLSRIFYFN
jgi:hypothetical protein